MHNERHKETNTNSILVQTCMHTQTQKTTTQRNGKIETKDKGFSPFSFLTEVRRREEREKEGKKWSREVTYGQSGGGILGWKESSSESVKIPQ